MLINEPGQDAAGVSKRDVLKRGLLGFAGLCCIPPFIGSAQASTRLSIPDAGTFNIAFHNIHTGESFSGAYRVGDRYLPEAFRRINTVLRDFRTGEEFPVDPRVMDILCSVHYRSGAKGHFEVLSGYRSPKTNAMLRATTEGVARNSLHMTGQAIDIRLPGFSTHALRNVGIKLGAGGVGYYPKSDFVHMETGRVRVWGAA
jgi:uncharacterized protein YcbK (DUF882 family)